MIPLPLPLALSISDRELTFLAQIVFGAGIVFYLVVSFIIEGMDWRDLFQNGDIPGEPAADRRSRHRWRWVLRSLVFLYMAGLIGLAWLFG